MDDLAGILSRLAEAVATRLDDHDLLIELRTTQRNISEQMEKLISQVNETVKDHERRIRVLERVVFYAAGMGALAWVLFQLVVKRVG